jgi:hypothetical protein
MEDEEHLKVNRKSDRLSLLISVIMHFVIGVLLISFGVFSASPTSNVEADRPGGIVLTEVNSNQQTEYIDQNDASQISDAFDAIDAPSESVSLHSAAASAAPELPVIDAPDLPGMPLELPTNTNANSMAEVAVAPSKVKRYELTEADLEAIAKDRAHFESLKPKGQATTINLFDGGGMSGRKFAFVIDRSHSMGGDGLGVLNEARQQLSSAIDGLELNHEFQIVAYHDKTTMITKRKLLVANDQNKRLVKDFFEGLGAFGATNHFYGLIGGLDLQPDVLVFMTDGGSPALSPQQLKRVKQMAGNRTEIHCIQFGSGPLQESNNFMKKLARQNRGSFRYINVYDWR